MFSRFFDFEQTVGNEVYFFKNTFEKMVFFWLLQVFIMTLLRQSVYLVSLVGFVLFFTNILRISKGSCIPYFMHIKLRLSEK